MHFRGGLQRPSCAFCTVAVVYSGKSSSSMHFPPLAEKKNDDLENITPVPNKKSRLCKYDKNAKPE